jgi:hypothetical protein
LAHPALLLVPLLASSENGDEIEFYNFKFKGRFLDYWREPVPIL